MTENEAINELQANIDLPFGFTVSDEVSGMAIQALEEIQQYRAIGTVEEFKALKEKIGNYNFCEGKLAEIKRHEEEIKSIRNAYNKKIVEYRMKSVDRVLDYIRHAKITDVHRLDILLCHCQNKLNGNIDGTELDLCEEKEGGAK